MEVGLDASYLWSASIFVNLALLFYVLGFLARDELWLRGLILTGTGFYLLYYYYIADTPLWDAILASAVLGLANLSMICVIVLERTSRFMSSDERGLYKSFHTLNPGQFRQVMKYARGEVLKSDTRLAVEGVHSEYLVFVVSGDVSLAVGDGRLGLVVPCFVAEVGFLLERPASATVTARAGTQVLRWKAADIRRLMRRKPELSNAMVALFNLDLARKVARSVPRSPGQEAGVSGSSGDT